MHKVLEELGTIGIIPVIKIDDPEGAVPLAKALAAGGIPCAEVTFRTAQGEEAIRRISAGAPEILVGAGTVLTTDQVDRAIGAGAQFIVSPGYNPKIVGYCLERGIPIAPGCSNPSDFEQALEAGLEVVKFFPAEQSGGIAYIKAVAAPYGGLKFIPTGGINAGNIGAYMACDRVLACGGTWMVSPELLKAGDFAGISALSREAVFAMLGFEAAHVGLNAGSGEAARQGAALISRLFGFPVNEGNSSIFAGPYLELMKSPAAAGTRGHIAIATTAIVRARAYLERQGVVFDPASIKTGAGGNLNVIFARDEILGFAWHLVQKK
ncbi:MAG: bifunctional 4-hydroxy-2-oxoglutarate aldolase/2-dehydro-3-deoxy-phosphogluconate aldolase [Treponema sp.]|jgi:2-dehydro-3-deoxyphosphogluconate aldolase/(4S)-4-hydroxy-2-oxoglutarate aldolase|nr:bifunctional 4-hydroxy-2-oxoglutarate aldolase/2-dehydro-3-deoxy-phosphogluconate aldolase [Treponema sp.]